MTRLELFDQIFGTVKVTPEWWLEEVDLEEIKERLDIESPSQHEHLA